METARMNAARLKRGTLKGVRSLAFAASLFLLAGGSLPAEDIPPVIADCFARLDASLTPEMKAEAKKPDAAASLHFSLGMHIRNSWGLWKGGNKIVDFFHANGVYQPDSMSGIILESYSRYLNGMPLRIRELLEEGARDEIQSGEWVEVEEEKEQAFERRFSGKLLPLSRVDRVPPEIVVPDPAGFRHGTSDMWRIDGTRCLVASTMTYDDSTLIHHVIVDTVSRKRRDLKIRGIGTIESVAPDGECLYACGWNGKSKALARLSWKGGKAETLASWTPPSADGFDKIFVSGGLVHSVRQDGLYGFVDGGWKRIVKFGRSVRMPSALPFMWKGWLMFHQERYGGHDNELAMVDMKDGKMTDLFDYLGFDVDYDIDLNEARVVDGHFWASIDVLMRGNTLIDVDLGKRDFIAICYRNKASGTEKPLAATTMVPTGGTSFMLMGSKGFTMLDGNKIEPVLDISTDEHHGFDPRKAVWLGEDRFLVGGKYEGLWLAECVDGTWSVREIN